MLIGHLSNKLSFQWVYLLFEFHLPSDVYRHYLPCDFPPIGEVNGFNSETKFVTGRNLSLRSAAVKEPGLQWDAEWQFHCLFNKLKAQLLHIHQSPF